jgi:hypothetical protein
VLVEVVVVVEVVVKIVLVDVVVVGGVEVVVEVEVTMVVGPGVVTARAPMPPLAGALNHESSTIPDTINSR